MSMTDPIADLLTRLRNACMARHRTVDVPTTTVKERILEVLKKQGYINGFQAVEGAEHATTRVYIRYYKHEPVIQHLQRVSRPGLRRYMRAADIPRVRGGLGIAIMSTPDGVLTGREARRRNVGGEILAEVW